MATAAAATQSLPLAPPSVFFADQPGQTHGIVISPPILDVTHQPHYVSSSSFTIIMYCILATALVCLWIWLVSIASQRIRRMPAFSILTLATLAYCVQTMMEVSRTVDLLTGKVTEDRERPVAIVFFMFTVPWISDWTFIPRLLAFFPAPIHSRRKRMLVIALPLIMKVVRAAFIILFTSHTYHITHGPPLDESSFYKNIAFSTAFPQLEWIATIVDDGYSTAFLIAHLMLFKRGHIRSQPLLSAVRAVMFASVATFALPMAFCCTSISLQYAHMDPKVTRDAWVAAEFVMVVGTYASCLAPTIRTEQLAKRALAHQAVVTPDASDLPPMLTPGRHGHRRPDMSRRNSARSKLQLNSCHQHGGRPNRQDDVELEMGSMSLHHSKDSPLSSPVSRVQTERVDQKCHITSQRPSLDDLPKTPSPPPTATQGAMRLSKSNSLNSLHESRPPPQEARLLPTLVDAHETDVNFRFISTHRSFQLQHNKASGIAIPTETSSLPFRFPEGRQCHLAHEMSKRRLTSDVRAAQTSGDKSSSSHEERLESLTADSPRGDHRSQATHRWHDAPGPLRFTSTGQLERTGWVTPPRNSRPWTSTGATSGQAAVAMPKQRSSADHLADLADKQYTGRFSIDAEMPFASNFMSSSPCQTSELDISHINRKRGQRSRHASPSSESGGGYGDISGQSLFSSSDALLSSPTRATSHPLIDEFPPPGWAVSLNKSLPAKPEAAVALSSSASNLISHLSPPGTAAGIIKKGKTLAINTAKANKFLLRPVSAAASSIKGTNGVDSGNGADSKRRGQGADRSSPSGRYSPTTGHGGVRRTGGSIKGVPPLPHLGHIEIAMQRTTRIDYDFDEERESALQDVAIG